MTRDDKRGLVYHIFGSISFGCTVCVDTEKLKENKPVL